MQSFALLSCESELPVSPAGGNKTSQASFYSNQSSRVALNYMSVGRSSISPSPPQNPIHVSVFKIITLLGDRDIIIVAERSTVTCSLFVHVFPGISGMQKYHRELMSWHYSSCGTKNHLQS